MGVIGTVMGWLFGDGRNVLRETAEVFRENSEARAQRSDAAQSEALLQMAAEMQQTRRGVFDGVMDALNRLPRPALALGTIALFGVAMHDPLWFAARMQGLALVPEPMWWLLGVIVSFYFGARHQAKSQEFHRDLAARLARAPQVAQSARQLDSLRADTPGAAAPGRAPEVARETLQPDANPALEAWRRVKGR